MNAKISCPTVKKLNEEYDPKLSPFYWVVKVSVALLYKKKQKAKTN